MRNFFERYWFVLLGGSYGFAECTIAGDGLTSPGYWVGLVAICATFAGAKLIGR